MRRSGRTVVIAIVISLAANGGTLLFLLVSTRPLTGERTEVSEPVLINLTSPLGERTPPIRPQPRPPPAPRPRSPALAPRLSPTAPSTPLQATAPAAPPALAAGAPNTDTDLKVSHALQGLFACGARSGRVSDPEARQACERRYLDYGGPGVGLAHLSSGARVAFDAAADQQDAARAARQGPLGNPIVSCSGGPADNLDRPCIAPRK